jgi:hypothetical protein
MPRGPATFTKSLNTLFLRTYIIEKARRIMIVKTTDPQRRIPSIENVMVGSPLN